MSKYILVVDLPDDRMCDRCPCYDCSIDCDSAWCGVEVRRLPDPSSLGDSVRPAWCPLCPIHGPEVVQE